MTKTRSNYQDKEELRQIITNSLSDLIRFHEIEKSEKATTLKFYSVFIVGGISLIAAMTKFDQNNFTFVFIKFISIAVVISVNYLMIKKLLSGRLASNNIYNEYGKRLKYLVENHTHSPIPIKIKSLEHSVFTNYYGEIKNKKELLPKYSADKLEIYGLFLINILFSLSFIIPFMEFILIIKKQKNGAINLWEHYSDPLVFGTFFFFILLEFCVFSFGYWLIKKAKNSPGYEND